MEKEKIYEELEKAYTKFYEEIEKILKNHTKKIDYKYREDYALMLKIRSIADNSREQARNFKMLIEGKMFKIDGEKNDKN